MRDGDFGVEEIIQRIMYDILHKRETKSLVRRCAPNVNI